MDELDRGVIEASGANGAATSGGTESDLIASVLSWCARRFGASAARFLRPTAADGWQVVTWMNDTISTHPADAAEVAMAWMVALGRTRLLVSRPRVVSPSSDSLRPISRRTYLGVPVICQDRVLGVIEVAGDLRPDIEPAAAGAQDEIDRFGLRLAFDPSLRTAPELTPDTEIDLGGGAWPDGEVTLSPAEFRFAAAISGPGTIAAIATSAGIPEPEALEIAKRLERLGIVEVSD